MDKPYLEPLGGNDFRIAYPDYYSRAEVIIRKVQAEGFPPQEAVVRLEEALERFPRHFGIANLLGEAYSATGDFEKACNVRFHAVQRFMELMPDDENTEISLDWEHGDNRPVVYLLRASAIDHFLAGDWEMATGLLETALELDGEDHMEVSDTLAFCYAALGEEELFYLTLEDIGDKDPAKALLHLLGAFIFRKGTFASMLNEFRKDKALYGEFTAAEHPVTPEYLADIDSERPSPEARARLLWLRTEHLWKEFPGFLESVIS